MAPYLILGFLIAGILKVVVPPNIMTKYLGKSNTSSVVNASLFGIPLPLCSCGVLPTGISLYKNGASKGSSVSFLISTPQTGVDSMLVTWSMLGLPMAILRPILAFFTGVAGGILTNIFDKTRLPNHIEVTKDKKNKGSRLVEIFRYAFIEMVDDLAKWLVIGLLIASFITVAVPDNFFKEFNITGLTGMILILVVSIPLYICATASVPIAAVLLLKGLSPGAILVFLMAGPATNAATITVIGKNLGKRALIVYMASLVIGSLLFGLLIDNFLPYEWFMPMASMMGDHQHEILPMWLSISSAVILSLFIFYSFIKSSHKWFKRKAKSLKPTEMNYLNDISIGVDGMTCNKCKAKIEGGLNSLDGVLIVNADIKTKAVSIKGEQLDLTKIENKVIEMGYEFKGIISN